MQSGDCLELEEQRAPFFRLPLPLKHAASTVALPPAQLPGILEDRLSLGRTHARGGASGRVEFSVVSLGDLAVVSGRTTPISSRVNANEKLGVKLIHAGVATFEEDRHRISESCGGLLAYPNNGGQLAVNHCAGIAFELDRRRLARTMQVIAGRAVLTLSEQPFTIRSRTATSATQPRLLFGRFFRFIDGLLQDNSWLPEALGLEEQVYRLFCLELLGAHGLDPSVAEDARPFHGAVAILDDLVAHIHDHLDSPLTLTDLEAHSSYSGRRLQQVFQERFQCTPMQYVRRARLGRAMELLQAKSPGASVSLVARTIGYRNPSNFAADFRQQFGISPSRVLRSSRGGP